MCLLKLACTSGCTRLEYSAENSVSAHSFWLNCYKSFCSAQANKGFLLTCNGVDHKSFCGPLLAIVGTSLSVPPRSDKHFSWPEREMKRLIVTEKKMWWKYELYMKWNDYCDYNQSQIGGDKAWTTAVTRISHRHKMRKNERLLWLSVTKKWCEDEEANLWIKRNDCCDSQSQKGKGVETSKMNGLTVVTISQMIQMIQMKWMGYKMKMLKNLKNTRKVCEWVRWNKNVRWVQWNEAVRRWVKWNE